MQSTGQRSPGELSEILALLLAHQVPLVYSARLLCDVAGINFIQVADAAGVGRGHLYKMLRGIRPVSASVRLAFMDCLGFDLWAPGTPAIEEERRRASAAFNAAINFALDKAGPEGLTFLSCWREGDWGAIAEEWPEFKIEELLTAQH
ncbi:MAG: hypothetical protein Q8Q28_18065 [Pseudomonadota bacterium]|nr:hypothetical protein [Pseudomonadota bacterium]